LALCASIYTLFQFVVAQIAGTAPSSNAVIDTASALLGSKGVPLVSAAVMLSTFGWLSGSFLNAPRFPLALAEHGDSPEYLGRLHSRFGTPYIGVVLYGVVVFALAASGSFIWAVELTAGALTIFYSVGCLALFRLRKVNDSQRVFRIPFGRFFAATGITLSGALLAQLEVRQIALMSLTCILAIGNWLWARAQPVSPDGSGLLRTYRSPQL
jgi:APA family basic amino acid/polyamine antiporter